MSVGLIIGFQPIPRTVMPVFLGIHIEEIAFNIDMETGPASRCCGPGLNRDPFSHTCPHTDFLLARGPSQSLILPLRRLLQSVNSFARCCNEAYYVP